MLPGNLALISDILLHRHVVTFHSQNCYGINDANQSTHATRLYRVDLKIGPLATETQQMCHCTHTRHIAEYGSTFKILSQSRLGSKYVSNSPLRQNHCLNAFLHYVVKHDIFLESQWTEAVFLCHRVLIHRMNPAPNIGPDSQNSQGGGMSS